MSRVNNIISSVKKNGTEKKKSRVETIIEGSSNGNLKTGVDEQYINSFINDAKDYISNFNEDYKNVGYNNASSLYENYSSKSSELGSRANTIRAHLNSNKNNLDADIYNQLISTLDDFEKNQNSAFNQMRRTSEYYSKWDTEEEYNQAIKDTEKLEKWADPKHLDLLNSQSQAYSNIMETYNGWDTRKAGTWDKTSTQDGGVITYYSKADEEAAIKERDEWFAKVTKQNFGKAYTFEEFKNTFGGISAEYAQAKRYQEGLKLHSDAVGATDFGSFSLPDSAVTDNTYKYINNIDGYRDNEDSYWTKNATYTNDQGLSFPTMKPGYINSNYNYMTDEEIGVYNYYYSKFGKEKANEYLSNLQQTLNTRSAMEIREVNDTTFERLFFGIEAGLDQFGSGVENLFNTTDDYITPSDTQIASGMIREDLADTGKLPEWMGDTSLGQVGYDLINTTSNMLPSILTSTVVGAINPTAGAVVGAGLMGASAAGNAYAEALNLGFDKGQARMYSTMVGGSEALLQYFLGGIGKLGGKLTTKTLTKYINNLDNAFARVSLKLGSNMASEFTEEYLQEVLTPYFKNLTLGTNEDINLFSTEALYSGILGALSAGILEGGSTIVSDVQTTNLGKKVQKVDGGVERLKNLGTTFSADTVAYQIADKVTNETGAHKIGLLLQEVGGTLSEQNVSDIVIELTKRGVAETDAKRIAKVYQAFLNKEMSLTDEQIEVLEGLKPLEDVLKKNIIGRNTAIYQRTREFDDLVKIATGMATAPTTASTTATPEAAETTSSTVAPYSTEHFDSVVKEFESMGMPSEHARIMAEKKLSTPTIDKTSPKEESLLKSEFEVSAEGKTINTKTGAIVNIQKIDSISEGGEANLTLDDGMVIKASDLAYGSDAEAAIIENIGKMKLGNKSISTASANALYRMAMSSISPDTKPSEVASLIKGLEESYVYGAYNFGREKLTARNEDGTAVKFAGELTQEQRKFAYELGSQDRASEAESAQKFIDDLKVKGKPSESATKKGKVYFAESVVAKGKLQKRAVSLAKHLAKAIGIDIVFYDARTTRNPNGKDANGYFDEATDTIYLDLQNSHDDAKTIVFTLSHELVHFIKKWSPAKFDTFAKFLVEQYTDHGVDVSQLVDNKMAELGTKDRDLAYEEMICDACETMLLDSNAVYKLMELRKTDLELFDKIKLHIYELLNKIRDMYKSLGLAPTSDEAKSLLGMQDVLEQMYSLFEEAAVDAVQSYQAVGTLETESVSVSEDGTIKMQMKQYQQTGRATLLNYLKEQYGAADANDLISTIDNIYNAMAEIKKDTALSVFGNWQDTEVELDENGHPIFTTSINNGDYKLNQDFSRVCKKRRQLDFVLNMLAEDPAFEASNLTKDDIVKINQAIKKHGFEIACALCFVDSKRFRQTEWADSFANTWNDILYSVVGDKSKLTPFNFATKNPNLVDDGIEIDTSKPVMYRKWSDGKEDVKNRKNYDSFDSMLEKKANGKFVEGNANVRAIVKILKENPHLRHTFRGADIIGSQGFDTIQRLAPNIRGILDGWGGTSVPKPSSNDAIYDNSVLNIAGYNAKSAFAIGGVRMNSFSDFMAHMFFDYVQAFADLSAKGLPMHSYTKELDFARLFGLTKGKINMSAIAAVRENATDLNKIKKKADKEKATEWEKSIAGLDISKVADKLGKAEADITYDDIIQNLDACEYVWADESIDVRSATLLQSGIMYDNLTEGKASYCYELIKEGKFEEAFKVAGEKNVNRDYAKHLGIITVGVSKAHILKLLRDPTIRMVIPYHKSGLNAQVAAALKIAFYEDFTDVQNTMLLKKDGSTVGLSKDGAKIGDKNIGDFNFYKYFGKTIDGVFYDGKTTAAKYIEWCEQGEYNESVGEYGYYLTDGSFITKAELDAKGLSIIPKFNEFAEEENYYKLVEDFDCYDTITGEHSSQEAVDLFHDGLPSDYKAVLIKALKAEQDVSDAFRDHLDNQGLRDEIMEIVKPRGYKPSVKKQAKKGVAKDGRAIYESSFPKGTPKLAKSERILDYIQNVWSKNPINLVISNGETSRTILAKFDPTIDEGQNTPTDASKIAGGNRHGNHTEQRVTLDLADDYYEIASEATYNYSKLETGKDLETHTGVKMWHYFVNDIYFAEYGEEELTPYTVTINVKEKDDGGFVYSFNAEKESPTRQTLHAAVNTTKGANGELFFEDIIQQEGTESQEKTVKKQLKKSTSYAPTFYSQMGKVVEGVKQEKLAANSVVNMLRGKGVKAEEIRWSGIVPFLEGKKSVTKQELLDFINGSMLQIEEETLTDREMPYSQEHLEQIAKYEAERDTIAENLKSEWKRIVGSDIPVTYFGAGLESVVVSKLIEADAAKKGETEVGYKYKAAMAALRRCIEYSDDYFGYDNEKQALRDAMRDPEGFMNSYEMTSFEKGVFRDFIKAKVAYRNLEGIPLQEQRMLKTIAESADRFSSRINQVKAKHRAEEAKYMTKWGQYKLKGGTNYRELLFKLPESTYTNTMMGVHWEDKSGILVHARVQDFEVNGKKMLFVEEIQSDWHNEGHKDGYVSEIDTKRQRIADLKKEWNSLYNQMLKADETIVHEINEKMDAVDEERKRLETKMRFGDFTPDAPFKDTYHEFVLKRLLRMAAEQGYDFIGWTPADIQSERWSDEYAEGYRIEYDQDMPKFLRKYGRQWGAKVGKTDIQTKQLSMEEEMDNALLEDWIIDEDAGETEESVAEQMRKWKGLTSVWSMDITDSMKKSVLYEGQALFQKKKPTNRSILANSLESAAQNDIERNKLAEYKKKISLIESEEQRLSEIQQQLFTKGGVDPSQRKDLQFEAKQIANRITTYDRQLLNLEATTALKNVLSREKELARKRQKQKDAEAMRQYKEKVAKTTRELMARNQESRKKAIEGREKTAMRHKIKSVVSELNQLLLRGTKDKHVMIGLQKAVAEALDAVNMDTVGAEERVAHYNDLIAKAKDPDIIASLTATRDRIQAQGDKMSDKLTKLKNAYNDIKNSDDPLIANSHDEVIASRLEYIAEKVGNTPLRDMTLEQLEDVYDMYKMVLTTIRNSNKSFKNAKNESIATLGNRVMMEVEKVGGKKQLRRKGTEGIEKFAWNNLKPIYAFNRIGSDTLTEVFNNVRAGEDTWAVDVTEAREYYLEQSKKHNYDSWDFKKRYKFTSTSGMDFELSLEQIMSLYAYSKREQAAEHLRKGGIVFDETTEVTIKNKLGIPMKFNPTEATAYNLSVETLADIVGKLSNEQRAFVDEMQAYLSDVMGEKGNEVSLVMYGVKLFKEKFYFPLKSATQFMAKAKEQQQGEVKIKNSGFSKETVQKASNPIVLTPFMDVWANHVNEMSMYHAFVLSMEDFYRVFNYKTPTSDTMATESVEMFIQNAYGKGATQYIEQLLKDLNGGAISDPRETFSKALMSKFKKAAVMASLSVVVQQPTAMIRAMALVDMRHFGIAPISRGIVRTVIPKKHKTLWAEVKKYAPIAIIKEMGRFDTNMGRSVQDFIKSEDYKGLEKVKGFVTDSNYRDDVLSKVPALADEMAWVAIWEAVKRETVSKHKDLKPNSEEFLKVVGERFTEVITKTQVYDSVLSRSANMRAKSAFMNMWTSFMAEPTTSINMLEDALRQGKRGDKKYAAKAIGAVYGSVVLNAALVSLVYAMRDDDEDETFLEKYASRLTTELLDGINPLTYIPFLKDIWSIAQGFDIERADMSLVADLVDTLQQTVTVISKDTTDMDEEELAEHQWEVAGALGSIADSISSLVGLPIKNVRRDINGAINLFGTLVKDANGRKTSAGSLLDEVWEDVKSSIPVVGWLPNETKGDKLYDAIVNGDTAYVDRLKSGYKDDKAYESAVRKALRENDSRIREAAEARIDGDIAEYTRIVKAIKAEGFFSQDTIVASVNAEINALSKGEDSSSSSDKAKSMYKIDDYFMALDGGDEATAYVVKEDLIETDVANGKDREEAEESFNSKFASYLREQYEEGNLSESEAQRMLVNYGEKTEEEATSKVQYWEFKQEYPDYDDLSEEAVAKYYEKVEPYGITVDVYYDYSKQRSKCKGTDNNGDGKTDSGSVKAEVLWVIHSLPLTYAQKDALYYLNGWSAKTIYEAPWH